MALPYNMWGPAAPPMPVQMPYPVATTMGGGYVYGIPASMPSSSPLVVNPTGAIRDFTEQCLNGDRRTMCDERSKSWIGEWAKTEDNAKVIMEVIKSRLDLSWPYNFKALDLLSVMPVGEIKGLHDKLKTLSETATTVEGGAELKKAAKPLFDKAVEEKKKEEEEEAKKKQEAIIAMWGGLWHNAPGQGPRMGEYTWGAPPGMVPVDWRSKAPEGWQQWVMVPVAMPGMPAYRGVPIMGWPRI